MNAAKEMVRLPALPELAMSDLGPAEPERTLNNSAKRPAIVFFHRTDLEKALVTGECKAP